VIGHNAVVRLRLARFAWAVPLVGMVSVGVTVALLIGDASDQLADAEGDALPIGVIALVFGCVGALIVSRQPSNAIGWIFCGVGLAGAAAGSSAVYAELSLPGRVWGTWLSTWAGGIIFSAVPLVLLLFPDGKPLSRRWRVVVWAAAIALIGLAGHDAFAPGLLEDSDIVNPAGIDSLGFLSEGWLGWSVWGLLALSVVAGGVSLVLRFRRSRGTYRQQMKWLALAAVLVGFAFAALVVTGGRVFAVAVVTAATILLLPVAVGIAILRHRLYDIDLIINRTLVYLSLTTVLALVYAVGVVGAGSLVREVTGREQSNLVVAASTLVVALLFRPIRTRVQSLVDRRFYRRKYDAVRTVESFSARLRDEIELETLATELVAAVDDTMQPAHVSIWLENRSH
jgi:hypothetical protein